MYTIYNRKKINRLKTGALQMENKKIILTGDRPTGKLHLGHYVGSLKKVKDSMKINYF